MSEKKILFICGSLKPGNGVGDYTLLLAKELQRRNYLVRIIAVYDYYVTGSQPVFMNQDMYAIQAIRIPADAGFRTRKEWLVKTVNEFQPHWISLQYVPFSFNKKGITYDLVSLLSAIPGSVTWHIMFHELWIRTTPQSSWKEKMLASVQKYLVHYLLRKVKPACITTSIPLYKQMLPGSKVSILPLFSNVPVCKSDHPVSKDKAVLKVIHFGSFTLAIDDLEKQFLFLQKKVEQTHGRVAFTAAGNGGAWKNQSIHLAKAIFGNENVKETGRLSLEDISEIMQESNIGLSRADIILAGKSGSTIAMLEHGLPVVLRGSEKDRDSPLVSIAHFDKQLLFPDSINKDILQYEAAGRLPAIAKLMIDLLETAGNSEKRQSR